MSQLLFATAMLVVMWLLLVRPQQQRVKTHQKVVASLAVGDEVVSAGGMFGRIVALAEDTDPPSVQLEVSPGVVIRIATAAIARPAVTRTGPHPEGPDAPDVHDHR